MNESIRQILNLARERILVEELPPPLQDDDLKYCITKKWVRLRIELPDRWDGPSRTFCPARPVTRLLLTDEGAARLHEIEHAEPEAPAANEQGEQPTTPPRPIADVDHSDDFRSVHWYGDDFTFTTMQAACFEVLYSAFQSRCPSVSQAHVLEKAGSNCSSEKLRDVFRGKDGMHPAWGTAIVEGERTGTYRLAKPK